MTKQSGTEMPLADRIAAALRGEATSDDIAALIGEVERTRAVATTEGAAARARALDPISGLNSASAARRECDERQFEIDRLAAALNALRDAHATARAVEAEARRQIAYDAARSEREIFLHSQGFMSAASWCSGV